MKATVGQKDNLKFQTSPSFKTINALFPIYFWAHCFNLHWCLAYFVKPVSHLILSQPLIFGKLYHLEQHINMHGSIDKKYIKHQAYKRKNSIMGDGFDCLSIL
jgi:hypothetical protein